MCLLLPWCKIRYGIARTHFEGNNIFLNLKRWRHPSITQFLMKNCGWKKFSRLFSDTFCLKKQVFGRWWLYENFSAASWLLFYLLFFLLRCEQLQATLQANNLTPSIWCLAALDSYFGHSSHDPLPWTFSDLFVSLPTMLIWVCSASYYAFGKRMRDRGRERTVWVGIAFLL